MVGGRAARKVTCGPLPRGGPVARVENVMPIIDAVRTSGIETLADIAAALNARGTNSGGEAAGIRRP
jgi:hypothetical protein